MKPASPKIPVAPFPGTGQAQNGEELKPACLNLPCRK